jgi:hypothetical protein
MKKIIISIVVLLCILAKPYQATSTKIKNSRRLYLIETSERVVLNALTIYNPTARQCDRTPFITASNSKIDTMKLRTQQFRWMALSRDLLKRWKGKFHYGDTVMVNAGDITIDGLWIIKDTMNKRYKKHGDLLFDKNVRTSGKWRNVGISRIKQVPVYTKI